MATSSTVANGDLATAAQYNDLRSDVLATHVHDGTDGSGTIGPLTGSLQLNDNIELRLGSGTGGDSVLDYNGTDTIWNLQNVGSGALLIALAGSFPSAPDGNAVHIWAGTAGTVTANAAAVLVVESANDGGGIAILGPNNVQKTIFFGEPANPAHGVISYFGSTDIPAATMEIRTGGNVARIRISAAAFTFQESTTISSTGTLTIASPTVTGNITGPATFVWATTTNFEFDVATLVHQTVSNSGGSVRFLCFNTSNTASSVASIECKVGGTSALNAQYRAEITGGQGFAWGLDNANSDVWALNTGSTLGTDDGLRMSTASPPVMSMNVAQGADFDYVCQRCGRHAGEKFTCCGLVEWHDDILPMLQGVFNQEAAIDHLSHLGVLYRSNTNEGAEEIWMNTTPAVIYSWSMSVQNRRRMDGQYEELDRRLQAIGA